jgi:hypothetical protein
LTLRAIKIVIGVFPLPPAARFPIAMLKTGLLWALPLRIKYCLRSHAPEAYMRPKGISRILTKANTMRQR